MHLVFVGARMLGNAHVQVLQDVQERHAVGDVALSSCVRRLHHAERVVKAVPSCICKNGSAQIMQCRFNPYLAATLNKSTVPGCAGHASAVVKS